MSCKCFFCNIPWKGVRLIIYKKLQSTWQRTLRDAHTSSHWQELRWRDGGHIRQAIYDGCGGSFLTWAFRKMSIHVKGEDHIMFAIDCNNFAALKWFTKRIQHIMNTLPFWLAVERQHIHMADHIKANYKNMNFELFAFCNIHFDGTEWTYSSKRAHIRRQNFNPQFESDFLRTPDGREAFLRAIFDN